MVERGGDHHPDGERDGGIDDAPAQLVEVLDRVTRSSNSTMPAVSRRRYGPPESELRLSLPNASTPPSLAGPCRLGRRTGERRWRRRRRDRRRRTRRCQDRLVRGGRDLSARPRPRRRALACRPAGRRARSRPGRGRRPPRRAAGADGGVGAGQAEARLDVLDRVGDLVDADLRADLGGRRLELTQGVAELPAHLGQPLGAEDHEGDDEHDHELGESDVGHVRPPLVGLWEPCGPANRVRTLPGSVNRGRQSGGRPARPACPMWPAGCGHGGRRRNKFLQNGRRRRRRPPGELARLRRRFAIVES